ncbi:inorganic diphosphatase [Luteimonas sp. XNQY3]|nr:inorganic diphosphatase [Luteimonas sp. XNQY3]MCD9006610.1 inorganic diphosphatase [Luteimonas sp. XNQY3]
MRSRVSATLLAAALACAIPFGVIAAAPPVHDRQPANAPDEAVLLVEIPAGGFTKYESDAEGRIFVDRFLSMPMAYPANYGSMPGTHAGDGDPLDALVLTRAPLYPGVRIRFRPLGVLRMIDAGDADAKIVGVPADDVDPTYAGIRSIEDLPAMERERIEAFFRVYKDLPAGSRRVELRGWGGVDEAKTVMGAAIDAAR